MLLSQRVVAARKKKGLTQEELAELTKLTVRTIQRIESGATTPRPYTLKAIAAVLATTFEELQATETDHPATATPTATAKPTYNREETKDFLQLLCLSCFSYLVLPLVHIFLPVYLLKKKTALTSNGLLYARRVIRVQVYWVIVLHLLLFLTLAYNLLCSVYLSNAYLVNYLVPFFGMYLVNFFIITAAFRRTKRMEILHERPSI